VLIFGLQGKQSFNVSMKMIFFKDKSRFHAETAEENNILKLFSLFLIPCQIRITENQLGHTQSKEILNNRCLKR